MVIPVANAAGEGRLRYVLRQASQRADVPKPTSARCVSYVVTSGETAFWTGSCQSGSCCLHSLSCNCCGKNG